MRERARIDDIVGSYVTLKNAGGGSLKGLCPFHDEKSPSFNVTPARGFFYCFGCQEGGDVIDFIQKIDRSPSTRRSRRWPRRSASSCGTTSPARRCSVARATSVRGWSRRTRSPRSTTSSSCSVRPTRRRPAVPGQARLRQGRRRPLRRRVRAARRRGADQATCAAAASPTPNSSPPAWPRGAARTVRPVPRPAAVADPGRVRRDGRVRRPPAVRRRPDRRRST